MTRTHPNSPLGGFSRRQFLGQLAVGATLPGLGLLRGEVPAPTLSGFRAEAQALLREWGTGLLGLQVLDASRPELHGSLRCPACGLLHGRCGDAALPLLALAASSGDHRYLDAVSALWGWMKNVDAPDGAWTNDVDPKSWKGITVFSSIAWAEALEWHGELLDEPLRAAIRARLRRAGRFIRDNFSTELGNINYAAAGSYGLALLGNMLDEPSFSAKGRALAHQVLAFFTPQDHFLFGEGHPTDLRSAKGCYPVDLGYNVTESLPSLVHYALLENDKEVLDAALASFRTHLEFMLPDGAWDNSWGTRSYKWTYWGSRTADGCQSAFIRLAATDPVFATAALRSLQLLRACTHDGLLHGGPHYAAHGVPPCVHHTFVQAKAIAGALHYAGSLDMPGPMPALPRLAARAVRSFPELDVHLAAFGPWRATISGYDWRYKPGLYQASGGAPGMLWHERLGPILAASLATYLPIEKANMQPVPDDEDFPLSCRVELRGAEGAWFTNLHDGGAQIRHETGLDALRIVVETRLLSAQGNNPDAGPCRFRIEYAFRPDSFTITAVPLDAMPCGWSLVVPVISRNSEPVEKLTPSRWKISKPNGPLFATATAPITRIATRRERAFNLIPGFEALPFGVTSPANGPLELTLTANS